MTMNTIFRWQVIYCSLNALYEIKMVADDLVQNIEEDMKLCEQAWQVLYFSKGVTMRAIFSNPAG